VKRNSTTTPQKCRDASLLKTFIRAQRSLLGITQGVRHVKHSLYRSAALAILIAAAAPLFAGMSATPAAAQYFNISYGSIHRDLAPHGDWVYSDRWGEVWIPTDVPSDFQPYVTDGYWADTIDHGWLWVSDYEWGDIPFHYGRWVNDPWDGWMWIPGTVWSPAWVIWRGDDQYAGWMPMPPDRDFLAGRFSTNGSSISFAINFGNYDNHYGYSSWYPDYGWDRFSRNWFFVDHRRLGDRNFRRWSAPRDRYQMIVRNSVNVTNYTIVNNIVVNRSGDRWRDRNNRRDLRRATEVLRKPQYMTRIDDGRRALADVQRIAPRGTGAANSAPPPSREVVSRLTERARGGGERRDVFDRTRLERAGFTANQNMNNQKAGNQNRDRNWAKRVRAQTPERGNAQRDNTPTSDDRAQAERDQRDRAQQDQRERMARELAEQDRIDRERIERNEAQRNGARERTERSQAEREQRGRDAGAARQRQQQDRTHDQAAQQQQQRERQARDQAQQQQRETERTQRVPANTRQPEQQQQGRGRGNRDDNERGRGRDRD